MALLGTFVLYGLAFAVVFASFVLARYAAGSIFRVTDRVAPFGEARPSGFVSARPGARLAVTLAGPLGVYAAAALICVLGLLLGGQQISGTTTVVECIPSGPAAAAGLKPGDRILAVDGTPVKDASDLRPLLTARAKGSVAVQIDRQGKEMRVEVLPGRDRKLGVQLGPNAGSVGVGLGQAIRLGVAHPYRVLAATVALIFEPATGEIAGPIGMTYATARMRGLGQRLLMVGAVQSIGLIWFLLVSLLLWPPRVTHRPDPVPGDPILAAGDGTVQARPGMRLVARLIDWTLFLVIPASVVPDIGALAAIIWLPIEALLLSLWGYTPGKWLLGIAVRDAHGRRPIFRGAFRRAAVAWTYGFGAATLFGLATAVLAYANLKRNGATYWDALGGYEVHQHPIGVGRRALAFLVLAGGIVVVILPAAAAR